MKNKCTIFFLLGSMLSLTICIGQTPLSEKEQRAFKERVQETAKNTSSITSNFEQVKQLEMLSEPIVSKGMLAFQAPDNILWQYTTPKAYKVIFKEELLLIDNNGKKDEIKLSSNKLFRSFNELIVNSIKGALFDEDEFEISYFNTAEGYLVKFIPRDKKMKRFVSVFELTFTQEKGEVIQVKLIEPNTDYTLIRFSKRKTNVKIPAETFTL